MYTTIKLKWHFPMILNMNLYWIIKYQLDNRKFTRVWTQCFLCKQIESRQKYSKEKNQEGGNSCSMYFQTMIYDAKKNCMLKIHIDIETKLHFISSVENLSDVLKRHLEIKYITINSPRYYIWDNISLVFIQSFNQPKDYIL